VCKARVVPCTSYGSCRIPICPQDGDEDCFVVCPPVLKYKDYCYYHDKFFGGTNLSAGYDGNGRNNGAEESAT
jgi:hypothetical protein